MSNIKLKRALLKSKKTLEAAQIKNAAALADVTAALDLLGADAPAKITRATKAAADEEPAAKKAPAKKAAAKKVAAEKPAKAPAKKAAAEKPAAAPKSAKASGPKKLG